jgi:hypothetical protein
MILDLLQTPLFIYSLIISLFIFAILYLWRKISGIENYMFILEKRINNIKKPIASSSKENDIYVPNNVNENIRVADMIMNEVFNNITQQDNVVCSNILECNLKETKLKKPSHHTKHNSPIIEHVTNKITTENITNVSNESPVVDARSIIFNDSFSISKKDDVIHASPAAHSTHSTHATHATHSTHATHASHTPTASHVSDVVHATPITIISAVPVNKVADDETSSVSHSEKDKLASDDDKLEIASTKSEIMSSIKLSGKKLLKLDLGKLKEYCIKLNVSSEGNKNQIIDRLLLL